MVWVWNNRYIVQTNNNIDYKFNENNYSNNKENIYSTIENNYESAPKANEYNNIKPPYYSDFCNQSNNNINNNNYNSHINVNNYEENTPQNKENINVSYTPRNNDDILENKTKIIPVNINNENVSTSYKPLNPQNNRGVNTTDNCCTRIDPSMAILTTCQFYTIIILSILLIISAVLNIILSLIENPENILIIIAIDFGLILYSIFMIFSVLRIKWIRKTATVICVMCFFSGIYGTGRQLEIYDKNEKNHNMIIIYNFLIRFILLYTIMHFALYGYWGINLCEKLCKR